MRPTLALISQILCLASASPLSIVRRKALEHRDFVNTTNSCQRLSVGMFEAPSLITPVSITSPNTTYGTSLGAIFTPGDISTVFNFDIPQARAGQTCTLQFLLPLTTQFANSASYIFAGPGTFSVSGFQPQPCPAPNTIFNRLPSSAYHSRLAPIHIQPGNAYIIDVGPCTPGTLVAGLTGSNDTTFIFQQNSGADEACPIGAFISYS